MNLILSRKGFDSGAGGYPNPILPSGRFCILPIPDKRAVTQYRHIHLQDDSLPARMGQNLGSLVYQLTERRISPLRRAHLDPDLALGSLPRKAGWRPSFGQRGAALGHLQKQGIGPGDLFLFFGWFKETEVVGGRLRYVKSAPDIHAIFGWLQIDKLLDLSEPKHPEPKHGEGRASTDQMVPDWLHDHPHVQPAFQQQSGKSGNVLYISRKRLDLPAVDRPLAGAGIFPNFSPAYQLSKGDRLRSIWLLPKWFMPSAGQPPLTYHGDPARWTPHKESVLLRTVGRGQEFVFDCAAYPESLAWVRTFFQF